MNPFRLALADLYHDAAHFLCAVILIASIIGPFLVLLGIKVGAITVLFSELRDDPGNLEIFIHGAHEFSAEDVEAVRNLADVAYAEGQNIVTTTGRLELQLAPEGDRGITGGYGTTGPGDPLTNLGGDLADDALILSNDFAQRLKAEMGSEVFLLLERGAPFEGSIEPLFQVAEILGEDLVSGKFVLLNARALSLDEAYGFGYAIPDRGVTEGYDLADRRDTFEKIRVYAASLQALPDLAARIEQDLGVRTDSKQREIRVILDLERNLNAVLRFVTGAGLIGLFFVLSAHFWSAVRRKRLSWSMLSLMGSPPLALAAVPVTQAVIVSLVGFLGGLLVYVAVARSIDAWFRPFLEGSERVAILPAVDALLVGFGVILISTVASAAAGYTVMRTDPADIIRSS